MSDIKRDTVISIPFEHVATIFYTIMLNKFRKRLMGTEIGNEERYAEARDIVKNLGFFDRCLGRIASFFMSVSFFFMADVDEEDYLASLIKEKIENED